MVRGKMMYNNTIIVQVSRRAKPMTGMLRKMMVVFAVLLVLMGITISQGFMLPGFLFVVLYFAYNIFSRRDYEYRLEGNQFMIYVILGKKYRREAHALDLKNIEVIAPADHERVAKYKRDGGSVRLKKFDYTSYDPDIPYYTMIVTEEGRKVKILLDLDLEMLQALKRMYPDRVFFA